MPINLTENLHNITEYLERAKFADYVSNPFYMSMINSLCLFIMIIVLGQEITIGLIFFILIYSFTMFFTFSYAYKKTIKPKDAPILQPGLSSMIGNSQVPVPRTSQVPVVNQNPAPIPNTESI